MKNLLAGHFIFLTTLSFGQISDNAIVVNAVIGYEPVVVELVGNGKAVSAMNFMVGRIRFRDLDSGYYLFRIGGETQQQVVTDSVWISMGDVLILDLTTSGVCIYDHPTDQEPVCPRDHMDQIVPIIYGILGHIKDSIKNEFHFGGCVVSDCDPKYFCKKHKIAF